MEVALVAFLYTVGVVERSLSFAHSELGRLLWKNERRRGIYFFLLFLLPLLWPFSAFFRCFRVVFEMINYHPPQEEDDEDLPP